MNSKLIIAAGAVLLTVAACTKEISAPEDNTITVTASIEEDNKTVLSSDGAQVLWEKDDEMEVFFNGKGSKLVSTNTEPAGVASFSGSFNGVIGFTEGFSDETPLWGLYPYNANASSDNSSVTTTLSDRQTGRAGSFAKGTAICLARSKSLSMSFYNVCSGVRFSVTKSGVKEAILKSNGSKAIAGEVKLAFDGGLPVVSEVVSAKDSIILSAPSQSGFEVGKWYYFVTIPDTLSEGFTMTFNTDTQYAVASTSKSFTFARGVFGSLSEVDKDLEYKDREIDDHTSLRDLAKACTTTETAFSCKFKNAVVTYIIDCWCHLEDESGAILYYNTGKDSAIGTLKVGDVINGEVSGKTKIHTGLPQIRTLDISKATLSTTTELPCTTITVSELLNDYDRYLSCRLYLKGVTVEKGISSGSSSARSGSISQGGSTINIYGTYSKSPAVIGKGLTGNLYCFPTYYNTTKQLSVYSSDDFEEGGQGEESAFTKLTAVGIYDLTDAESPSALYLPSDDDQLSSMSYSDALKFNMCSLSGGYAVKTVFDSKSLSAGVSTTAHISKRGSAAAISSVPEGDFSVVVAKKSGKMVWVRTSDSQKGFIINVE